MEALDPELALALVRRLRRVLVERVDPILDLVLVLRGVGLARTARCPLNTLLTPQPLLGILVLTGCPGCSPRRPRPFGLYQC